MLISPSVHHNLPYNQITDFKKGVVFPFKSLWNAIPILYSFSIYFNHTISLDNTFWDICHVNIFLRDTQIIRDAAV